MHNLNIATNSKMAWLSFVSLAVCLSVAGLQFWHLKTFFQKKKLIWKPLPSPEGRDCIENPMTIALYTLLNSFFILLLNFSETDILSCLIWYELLINLQTQSNPCNNNKSFLSHTLLKQMKRWKRNNLYKRNETENNKANREWYFLVSGCFCA